MPKKDFKAKAAKVETTGVAKRTRSASKDNIEVDNIEKTSTKTKKYFKESILNDKKVEEEEVYPNQLEDYIKDKKTIQILRQKGVKYLFPIQEQTYKPVYEGKDLIGKDRTGSGKTLAFGIPIVERLRDQKLLTQRVKGQKPYVLIMLPTRELAIQVAEQFKSLSHDNGEFRVTLVYGGDDIYMQMQKLREGTEVVIGTPGRIMDLYNRGRLVFSDIKTVVLDEADEMLNLGFVDDIKKIFEFIKTDTGDKKTQNVLFSATIPSWMSEITKNYLTPDRVFVDLIKEQKIRTSKTIEHFAINCPYQQIADTIGDVILCYGGGTQSKCIIFTETKKECNEILIKGKIKQDIQAIHGDIPQKQREITFKAFKEGKVQCLVATNVAARGLDIPEIDLVIQCEPPKDIESYIHRSGRTGRAGKKGVCITFYNKRHFGLIERIEKSAAINLKRVGAPQPQDIMQASARDIASSLKLVKQEALALFEGVADELIEDLGPKQALARAIAFISGVTEGIKSRSLLCSMEGFKTFQLKSKQEFKALGYIWSFFRNQFPADFSESVKGLKKIGNGGNEVVFDVPEEQVPVLEKYMKEYEEGVHKWGHEISVCTELPEVSEQRGNQSSGDYINGGFRERADAKKNKRDLELFIGGFPFDQNEKSLADLLQKRGARVLELRILYGDDGRSKGLGFALLKSKECVKKALSLNGTMLGGRSLRVNMAANKGQGGR